MQYILLAGDAPDEPIFANVDAVGKTPAAGGPQHYEVSLGDRLWTVEAVFLPDGSLSVRLEGEQHHVHVDALGAQSGDVALLAEVLDLRRYALRRAQSEAQSEEGQSAVCAPMAGKLARLLVAPGASVTAGQPLLVVEAMKMENEVRAPRAGRLAQLCCQIGEQVAQGALLCRIDE